MNFVNECKDVPANIAKLSAKAKEMGLKGVAKATFDDLFANRSFLQWLYFDYIIICHSNWHGILGKWSG